MPSFSHVTAHDTRAITYSYSYIPLHIYVISCHMIIHLFGTLCDPKGVFIDWLTQPRRCDEGNQPAIWNHLKRIENQINRKGFIHANWGMKHDESEIKSNQSQQTAETDGCFLVDPCWSTPPRLGNISEAVNARLANFGKGMFGLLQLFWQLNPERARHTNIWHMHPCNNL